MDTQTKILIIIPAYNEQDNIVEVINNLKNDFPQADLVVINDGSKDKTEEFVRKCNVTLINHRLNLGIGGTVQTGFKYAFKYNYDIAIQFDGDGQHNSKEIEKLIKPILERKADVVIGSRFIDKKGFQSTFLRRIGIKIFEILNFFIIKQKITDNTSGFRAFNKKAIELLSKNYPQDFPEPEAIILLGKKQFKILEIPVLMNERKKGKSSISGLKSAYYMIKVILAILITSIRKV